MPHPTLRLLPGLLLLTGLLGSPAALGQTKVVKLATVRDTPWRMALAGPGAVAVAYQGAKGVDLIDLATGKANTVETEAAPPWTALAASPTGHLLALASQANRVVVIDARTAKVARTVEVKVRDGQVDAFTALAINADGRLFGWSAGTDAIRLYNADGSAGQQLPLTAGDQITALALAPNGGRLYALGLDKEQHTVLYSFSPNSFRLVARHDLAQSPKNAPAADRSLGVSADSRNVAGAYFPPQSRWAYLLSFPVEDLQTQRCSAWHLELPATFRSRLGALANADGELMAGYLTPDSDTVKPDAADLAGRWQSEYARLAPKAGVVVVIAEIKGLTQADAYNERKDKIDLGQAVSLLTTADLGGAKSLAGAAFVPPGKAGVSRRALYVLAGRDLLLVDPTPPPATQPAKP